MLSTQEVILVTYFYSKSTLKMNIKIIFRLSISDGTKYMVSLHTERFGDKNIIKNLAIPQHLTEGFQLGLQRTAAHLLE